MCKYLFFWIFLIDEMGYILLGLGLLEKDYICIALVLMLLNAVFCLVLDWPLFSIGLTLEYCLTYVL